MATHEVTVLIAEDDPGIRLVINQTLVREGYRVKATESVDALMKWLHQGDGDVVVTDVYLGEQSIFDSMREIRRIRPDTPVIVISAQNTILTAASAMDLGATDYLPKPFRIDELSAKVARALEKRPRRSSAARKRSKPGFEAELPLAGRSGEMQEVYRRVSRAMNLDLPVLVLGEMGTGKARAAAALHTLGRRREGALVNLLEWLHGTGPEAMTVPDIITGAEGGTLVAPEVQRLRREGLLRLERLLDGLEAVDDGRVAPRLVATATPDLGQAHGKKRFPPEILHRLNVIPIELPPLRARRDDIPDLVNTILAEAGAGEDGVRTTLDEGALSVLQSYDWPGNVRELKSCVLRLSALCPHEVIGSADVAEHLQVMRSSGGDGEDSFDAALAAVVEKHFHSELAALAEDADSQAHQRAVQAVERPLIALALRLTRGNKLRAAAMLGMNRNTLRARIQALGME